MSHFHSIVWLDHQEARVIDFSPDDVHRVVVHKHGGYRKVHHRAGAVGAGHAPDDLKFFDEIVTAVGDAGELLVVGPGVFKTTFSRHLEQRHPAVSRRVVGIETLDHPGDGELLAYARKYFHKVDQVLGTSGREG